MYKIHLILINQFLLTFTLTDDNFFIALLSLEVRRLIFEQ